MPKENRAQDILDSLKLAQELEKLLKDRAESQHLNDAINEVQEITDIKSMIFEIYKGAFHMADTYAQTMEQISELHEELDTVGKKEFFPKGNA